jgi:hypothetical protein
MAIHESIELVGAEKAQHDFDQVMRRMLNHRTGMRRTIPLLEEAERATFAELGGRYVKTGATKRSLTEARAEGAVRRPSAHALAFGTKVWYARFLTEEIGPPTAGGGMKRNPPSAVISKPSEATQQACAEIVMRYIVGDVAGGWGL